ncbi:MAG: hypothetical protein ACSHW1_18370 [Yoonia sp.]
MKRTQNVRRACLPQTIIRHVQEQGLGWGHDLYPCDVWIKIDEKKGR